PRPGTRTARESRGTDARRCTGPTSPAGRWHPRRGRGRTRAGAGTRAPPPPARTRGRRQGPLRSRSGGRRRRPACPNHLRSAPGRARRRRADAVPPSRPRSYTPGMVVCPSCGEENPARFRLCGFCGAPLAEPVPVQEVRKTVTIVFSDLKGSTSLGERIDSEALREVMSRYFEEMRGALEEHGGLIEKYIGDAIMAVFGLPRIREDDALRAVRAADEMKRRLAVLNEELEQRWGVALQNRTGVNTGEIVAGDPTSGQRLVIGDTVNVAARLEQAAGAQEVLIGEPTYRLVRDSVVVEPVEPLELKGKAERVPAYRLVSVEQLGMAHRRQLPLVGRDAELEALESAFEAAVSSSSCRLVTVVAQAGVGKSRLIEEFFGRMGDRATALSGRCLPYGRGITFWPLIEAVRQAAGIDDDDSPDAATAKIAALTDDHDVRARIASAIGLGGEEF